MEFYLNGEKKIFEGDNSFSLLSYLRDIEGITSPKDGCAPQAACGACTVIVDGKATLSCATPMKKVEDKNVTTIEGLSEYKQRVFANAFVEKSGVQCGFCIPGIVMSANALIDKNSSPSRSDIELAIHPNLCRCTGYKKIVDSIEYAAEAIKDTIEIPKPPGNGKVGKRHPKYNAGDLVLGKFNYVADVKIDGMLHGALKLSDHPRALVKSIDLKDAQNLDGVVRILTAEDIPGKRLTGLIKKDWPLIVKQGEETRYVGDVLAIVLAGSEAAARSAVEKIEVEYDVLDPVSDPETALGRNSPQIHPDGNLLSETIVRRGNIEEARLKSKFISKGTYETQVIEHGYMEPECCVAKPCDKGVHVLSQGQGVYEDRAQIADILGLEEENVRVVLVPNGGGFGGKEDLSVQGHAALSAFLLQKPVRIALTRDESIRMHPKRHPIKMDYELGCDDTGKFTYLKADIIGDTGAYASVGMKVLERSAGHATGPYSVPNAEIDSKAVYTNNIPCGAMRGFGVNQVTFAMESCIDDLCAQGGFDRWQIRYDNALTDGGVTATGQVIKGGAGIRDTLLAVKDSFKEAKYAGIACGIKNTGIGNGMPDQGKVKIEIVSENEIILNHGWTEMGQGVNTMAVQFFCEHTNLDPGIVKVVVDTESGAYSGMTTASRATSIVGNSIKDATLGLISDLNNHTLSELTGKTYEGAWKCDWTTKPEDEVKDIITHYSYSYATQVVILDEDGKIIKVIAAHDAGRIINPGLFEGQIEGSVHMGLGYAISEELVSEDCAPVSTKLRKCGILRAKETPEIEVIGIEVADPHGPFGAKGVGEIGLVPTAGAVANAFSQYDGIRYYKLPIKDRKKARQD